MPEWPWLDDLSSDERIVLIAALAAMVLDVHSVQDSLTEDQWRLAESWLQRLDPQGPKPATRLEATR